MSKGRKFTGQPIFSQVLNFIKKSQVKQLARKHSSDRYCKKFTTYDHLVTMLYCIFQRCTSLREVSTGMQACYLKLNHLGMTYCPRRSTLSDANRRRDAKVFEAIFFELYEQLKRGLPDSRKDLQWFSKLYIIDSTTISLFKDILKNAGCNPANGKRKGGVKVHTVIRAEENVPCFVELKSGASSDKRFIKDMILPAGSIVTFDKGYVDYGQYKKWDEEDVIWITRLRHGTVYSEVEQFPLDPNEIKEGVRKDETLSIGVHKSKRILARRITFYDSEKDKHFEFITNDLKMSALTIAMIYKQRWQIELLFKRLKQSFPLKYFLGDNENAIKIQVWCVLIADLLISYIKRTISNKHRWSYANLASMIKLHLMTYISLFEFLSDPEKALINNLPKKVRGPTLFD
ncbi:MAG: IS4 family transposase [Saprospiraceae bacterium]